jgi:TetR/AcrR family transcriptional repressor of nem operon
MIKMKKSVLTKKALLEEGMQQLAENGYHGTGIKKVLDVVKVPKGSFYNYFASKEAYVSDIIEDYNAQALKMFDDFVAQSNLPAIDQLKAIYQFMLDKLSENKCQQGCLIGSIAAEIGHSFELCQRTMQVGVDDWLSRITLLIKNSQKQGSVRNDLSARDIAEVLWSTWEGSLIKMKMDGDIKSPEKIISLMLNKILTTK